MECAEFIQEWNLYGTEAVALNATQRRSLSHTWQYVVSVSKVFHITGDNVSFVCNVTEAVCPSVNS